MSEQVPPKKSPPSLDIYQVICLVAVLILTMVLLEKGLGLWCLLVAIIGLVGILGAWRTGPVLLLGILTVALIAHARGVGPLNVLNILLYRTNPIGGLTASRRVEPVQDLLACAAVLAYVVCHTRFMSIKRAIFPPDTRKPPPDLAGIIAPQRRSSESVRPFEIGVMLASLPLFVGVAALVLFWLMRFAARVDLFADFIRAPLLLLWLGGFLLALFAAVFGYKKASAAGPEETLLYLQDQLWRQTRREQGRIHRWLTWARLKKQRRQEKP